MPDSVESEGKLYYLSNHWSIGPCHECRVCHHAKDKPWHDPNTPGYFPHRSSYHEYEPNPHDYVPLGLFTMACRWCRRRGFVVTYQ